MKTETQKICFSYIRFSTKIQSKGDSERRQLEIAPRVAKEYGWTLDETLNAQDLGLSAYKKFNLRDGGGLRSVIEAAKGGQIPRGSIMIVEALDRLFRLPVDDGYQMFRDILKSGIEIYTDNNRRHLTEADLNNPMSVMMTVTELYAAGQYSAILSERVGKAWKRKREALANGERLTKKVPSWINPKTFEPDTAKVKTIQKIFEMYENGYGVNSIARKLNQTKVPVLNKAAWSAGYISYILHCRAVIGEFQPSVVKVATTGNYSKQTKVGDVIQRYYPVIVNRDQFLRVQAKLSEHKAVRKTDNIVNLIAGIAFCSCGSKMYVSQGKSKNYLVCWNKTKALPCDNHKAIRYDWVEKCIQGLFLQNANLLYRPANTGEIELETLRARLLDAEKKVKNITAALEIAVTKANVLRQSELETEIETIKSQIETASAKTTNGNADKEIIETIRKGVENLATDKTTRRLVRDWLITNVESIKFGLVVKSGKDELNSCILTFKGGRHFQFILRDEPIISVSNKIFTTI